MKGKRELFRKLHSLLSVLEHWQAYRLRRHGVSWRLYVDLSRPWLTQIGFRTILDIGAHNGSWSRTAHAVFPDATVYAFEPLPDCFRECVRRMKGIAAFRPFNIALGEWNGPVCFYASSFCPASSVLPMTAAMRRFIPQSSQDQALSVSLRRLDDVIEEENLDIRPPILVKIDVQGYEDHVIRGGQQTLSVAQVVIIETSFDEFYTGQVMFDEIADSLRSLGLRYKGAFDQFVSPIDGHILQQDSIFIRKQEAP